MSMSTMSVITNCNHPHPSSSGSSSIEQEQDNNGIAMSMSMPMDPMVLAMEMAMGMRMSSSQEESPLSSPGGAGTTASEKSLIPPGQRVCDFYLSTRGCMKGDACDFLHPSAPSGARTIRICAYYSTSKGCSKGDTCIFLHPVRTNPRGEVANRICEYFLSPAGCLKGGQCDFIHPRAIPADIQHRNGQIPPSHHSHSPSRASPHQHQHPATLPFNPLLHQHTLPKPHQQHMNHQAGPRNPFHNAFNPNGMRSRRVCEYFNSPNGCAQGDQCRFEHASRLVPTNALTLAAIGRPNLPHFQSPMTSGHGQQVCEYFLSPRGCRHGSECKYAHSTRAPKGEKKPKVCSYFSTETGCSKGVNCQFIHMRDKICEYYLSDRGCKKGDLCGFRHPDHDSSQSSSMITSPIVDGIPTNETLTRMLDENEA